MQQRQRQRQTRTRVTPERSHFQPDSFNLKGATMATRKVRVGEIYFYVPVLIDRMQPPYGVTEGDEVVVINKAGCPRANVMGHCYVSPVGEKSFGLVCTNSLVTRAEYREILKMKLQEMEAQATAKQNSKTQGVTL